jgi:demethylmenaquinone methyltransferase/2-methoxy-6-polyprenyl-1,4-benzoquinol methylase
MRRGHGRQAMSEAEPLKSYYARRAAEYERIYAKPERQADLEQLIKIVCERLAGRRVLEIACGTGWWTERYAPLAASVVATDVNEDVLAVARSKQYPEQSTRFAVADAFALNQISGEFDAVFAGFWWSHLERAAIPAFLAQLNLRLAGTGDARVLFLDNRYVEGSSTPITETDTSGNTYQLRKLDDGSTHRVLKNFPRAAELNAVAAPFSRTVQVTELQYFWILEYGI